MRRTLGAIVLAISLCTPVAAGNSPWEFLGPFGGDARSLATTSEPGVVWVGMDDGFVFRSDDAGATWNLSNLPWTDILALTVDPNDPKRVFASTGWGLFRTEDGGTSWHDLQNPLLLGVFASELVADPLTNGRFYLGDSGVVLRTDDAGDNWSLIFDSQTVGRIEAIVVDPADPNVILLATSDSGVFRSVDGGASWMPRNVGLGSLEIRDLVLQPLPGGALYVATEIGVDVSIDGGDSWSDFSTGLGGALVMSLAVAPGATDVVVAGSFDDGIFVRDIGAPTWSTPSLPPEASRFRAIQVDSSLGGCLYAGSDISSARSMGGVWKSCDQGTTWAAVNAGLAGMHRVTALRTMPATGELLVGHDPGGPLRFDETTGSWVSIRGAETDLAVSSLDAAPPNALWLGSDRGRIFSSANGGASWSLRYQHPMTVLRITETVVAPDDPLQIYAALDNADLLGSLDGGVSWNSVAGDLPFVLTTALASSTGSSPTLYQGQASGLGLYESTNGGSNWHTDNSGLQLGSSVDVVGLVQNPQRPEFRHVVLWDDPAGGGTGTPDVCEIYSTTESPASWVLRLSEDTGCVGGLGIDPEQPSVLVMAFPNGTVAWSGDRGHSFVDLPEIRLGPLDPGDIRQDMEVVDTLVTAGAIYVATSRGVLALDRALLMEILFTDGFESGDLSGWPAKVY